ncbi:helix-turn-helix domain-containing protein [Companilactobacillus kedongensis]|uniref:helix-turn-helix domain-containing protein n=1 Tax=Companilactobacillus kedongensis TaxID=2486004 RepID=UPI001CDD008F|nr:transposase [Companilactobacillus kedongensis]
MVKFNLDLKTKIVTEYFNGCGSTTLAKKYGIASKSLILNWVHSFDLRGVKGLEPRRMNLNYSSQFKVQVLNWKNQNKASLPATALHFNLSSPSTVWQWQKKFDEIGIAGLEQLRGNPKMIKRKNENQSDNNSNKKDKNEEVKRLRQENLMLKIQNEYLKKVEALAQKKSVQKKSRK